MSHLADHSLATWVVCLNRRVLFQALIPDAAPKVESLLFLWGWVILRTDVAEESH
jgi:hypothetical protein